MKNTNTCTESFRQGFPTTPEDGKFHQVITAAQRNRDQRIDIKNTSFEVNLVTEEVNLNRLQTGPFVTRSFVLTFVQWKIRN